MFNKRKRFLGFVVPPLLTVLAALWSAIFSKDNQSIPYLPYIYVGVIAGISVLSSYFTQIKPSRDLEKPVLALLSILAEAPLAKGRKQGIKPRINLMIVQRKWTFLGKKRIRVVWGQGMKNHPDVQFSCNHDQGVAGQALKTQLPVLDDCESQDKSRFRFNPKQLWQTNHVTAVWSWPVYETDNKGEQTGKIVAVVNFDCTQPGAFTVLSENSIAYEKSLKRFCEIASTII
jgi:hypothetical protein